jgi:hypothetical protein
MYRMTRSEVDQIVTMTAEQWAAHESALVRDDVEAYSRYHGVDGIHPVRPGTPQAAGHGDRIGGFVGQEEWHAARARLVASRRVRLGLDGAWDVSVRGGVATYAYRLSDVATTSLERGYAVEVETHGVDVSDCPTPADAIAKVQAAFATA